MNGFNRVTDLFRDFGSNFGFTPKTPARTVRVTVKAKRAKTTKKKRK
ncbi:MAG: hypothetical protein ABIE23_03265 [archaeon]|nr:hypothetical protein [Candidatus Micrarchaeota archaeon]